MSMILSAQAFSQACLQSAWRSAARLDVACQDSGKKACQNIVGREIAIDNALAIHSFPYGARKNSKKNRGKNGRACDDVDDDDVDARFSCASCLMLLFLHSEYAPRALTIDTLVLSATRHLQTHAKHSPRVLGRDDAVIP